MMGDLNAKVGEGADLDCGIGTYGLGTRNNNGQKLAELCQANNLILTNTLFCHHRHNRYTWISPDNNTRNQIDYIAVNKQWASSILDAKSRPGAECYTDHILTSAKLRIKAFRNKSNKLPLRFDVDRLRDDEDLKPLSHRIVRLLDRTIGCYLANVRPIGNVCYDRQQRSHTAIGLSSSWLVIARLVVRVVARSTTIVEDRTTSGSHKRSIVRSIVAPDDRSYDQ